MKKYIVTVEEVEEHSKTLTEKEKVGRELDAILDGYTPPAADPGKEQGAV